MAKSENLSLTFCCPLTPLPLPRWGEEKGMPPKASLAKGGVKFQIFWAGSITI